MAHYDGDEEADCRTHGIQMKNNDGECVKCAEASAPQPVSPSNSSVLLADSCPECGSTDTEWSCVQQTNSCVADGRLRMGEVKTIFSLGCNSCSETIRNISGDEVARMMTQYR